MDTARALVANPVLWGPVRDFLFDFAPQVHPSHLKDEAWLAGGGVPQAPRLRKFLLERLGVEPFFHAFPADDGSRLLLLDSQTLQSVAAWLGAVVCSGELRRITDGATVRALRAGMPDVYPAVLAYAPYFHDLPEVDFPDRGDDAAPALASIGCGLVLSLLAGLPEPLLRRLRLKLPADIAARDLSGRPGVSLKAVLLLLKLRFPEAHSLCCS